MNKYLTTLQNSGNVATFDAKEALEFAALADAKNTQRAYLSGWKQFLS